MDVIKVLSLNGISKDYLEVLYQGTDKIYIPVEKINLISKYSGREGASPRINKLGGVEWKKIKSRVKTKVKDIAQDLIKLYAEREHRRGFAFSPDCDLSYDFESSFSYEFVFIILSLSSFITFLFSLSSFSFLIFFSSLILSCLSNSSIFILKFFNSSFCSRFSSRFFKATSKAYKPIPKDRIVIKSRKVNFLFVINLLVLVMFHF